MTRQCAKQQNTPRDKPPPRTKPPTPTCCIVLLRTRQTKESRIPTYSSRTPTEDGDIIVLELFVDGFPDQPGPNHCSLRRRVVRYLGEPSGTDENSLGGRKSGIHGVTTTLDLRRQGVRCLTVVRDCKHLRIRTAKGTFSMAITLN